MHAPEQLAGRLRASGRKVTPQRQGIIRALEDDNRHPSAEMVFEAVRSHMETISLKTVYQTLNDLADLGEIQALDLGTGALRFDPNVERPHHHLVCRGCGEVRDVFTDIGGLELPESAAHGYDVDSAEVIFRGTCDRCRTPVPTQQSQPTQEDQWPI